MSDIKITKHTIVTYETSDGKEFDCKKEAMEWQKHLCNIEDICMLDNNYKPTKNLDSAFFVYAKTTEQAEAFNAIQADTGYIAGLPSAGFYRYDEIADEYIEIKSEIEKLQHYIDVLKGCAKMDVAKTEITTDGEMEKSNEKIYVH